MIESSFEGIPQSVVHLVASGNFILFVPESIIVSVSTIL